jgi:1,2-phenylacetyl-CoA epoxidase PaaB subunit
MAETENANSQTRFIRRSDTDSICAFCSSSIRTERSTVQEEAEDIHSDVCLARSDSQLSDIIL